MMPDPYFHVHRGKLKRRLAVGADGEIVRGKNDPKHVPTGDFRLRAEIPFASVTVEVPLNAGDPLTAAKAIAARKIQLTETK